MHFQHSYCLAGASPLCLDMGYLLIWTSPDGQYWNQIHYIIGSQRWRSSIQSAKTRPEADCGSDHELLICKFWLKLKKVGKSTTPFRYDQNQIPNNYTVEVRNRFKGLDLIECLMNYRWRFMTLYRRQKTEDRRQKTGIKNIPKKKKCKRSRMAVWGGLSNSYEKKRSEKPRRKGKI